MNNNDLMLFGYWATVVENKKNKVVVQDVHTGDRFEVKGKALIDAAFSADQYDSTEKVTKTELAEKLITSPNRPLTVKFTKQDGTKRTVRGRFLSTEAKMGRSYVEDMDVEDDHKTRLVDHRTMSELIVDNVQYLVKG